MNSLRIERANGHLLTAVLFSFPLFAYCTLFSYVFFFHRPEFAQINMNPFPSLAISAIKS